MSFNTIFINKFKNKLTKQQKNKLKKIKVVFVKKFQLLAGTLYADNLNKLSVIHKTDKWNLHWYTQHYHEHFKKLRKKRIKVFEIGVGGYNNPQEGGASLRMWKNYFSKAHIYSLDIYDKSALNEKRIKIFKGSQINEELLRNINRKEGPFNIIIDDGSHVNKHIIKSFNVLFPLLKNNGIYVIEDLQTSYWNEYGYGGNSDNLNDNKTAINYFRNLVHCLNHKEFLIHGYQPTYFDKHIISMHFYHNMVFICKGDNSEESNAVVNNEYLIE